MAMRQIYEQQVIPAISTMKEFEKYLDNSETYAILMDFHLSMFPNLIVFSHKNEKRLILHLDLVKCLSSVDIVCEYACQVFVADGIISTNANVVETL